MRIKLFLGKIDTDKLLELYLKNKNSKDKKVNRLAKVNSIKNLLTTAWKVKLSLFVTQVNSCHNLFLILGSFKL